MNPNRYNGVLLVLSLVAMVQATVIVFMLGGCRGTEAPIKHKSAVAVAGDHAAIDNSTESVQPNVHPLLPEEYAAISASAPIRPVIARASLPVLTEPPSSSAPLRTGIAIPINASLTTRRMNLGLIANVYDLEREQWNNPDWRQDWGVDDRGRFRVRVWRHRGDEYKHVTTLIVNGPSSLNFDQFPLSVDDWRGGDVLILETGILTSAAAQPRIYRNAAGNPIRTGYAFTAYCDYSGVTRLPLLSVIQPASNDPNGPFGAQTLFMGTEALIQRSVRAQATEAAMAECDGMIPAPSQPPPVGHKYVYRGCGRVWVTEEGRCTLEDANCAD